MSKFNKSKTIILPNEVKVIVFDVDNTIVKGTTLFHAVKSLETIPQSERKKLVRLLVHNLVYNVFSFENGLDFAKNEGLKLIKNYPADFFKKRLKQNLKSKIDKKVYKRIIEDIGKYKNEGKIIVLASAAPDFLVEVVADKVGADSYIGTVLEERNGVFTGETLGEVNHGVNKAKNVKKFMEQNSIRKSEVACFTDSIKDIKLLELAGSPVATNPDLILRIKAKRHEWDILDYSHRLKVTKIAVSITTAGVGALALVTVRRKYSH
jgi:HAD superfamily hydrolase (TIGR01490 family)